MRRLKDVTFLIPATRFSAVAVQWKSGGLYIGARPFSTGNRSAPCSTICWRKTPSTASLSPHMSAASRRWMERSATRAATAAIARRWRIRCALERGASASGFFTPPASVQNDDSRPRRLLFEVITEDVEAGDARGIVAAPFGGRDRVGAYFAELEAAEEAGGALLGGACE